MSVLQHQRALVVGGGIIGLTTARALQDRGLEVILKYIKSGDQTTSGGSGGYWMPFHAEGGAVSRWAETTLAKYQAEQPSPLIESLRAFSIFASDVAPATPDWGNGLAKMEVINGRRALEEAMSATGVTLPEGYESAWAFETVVVDSPKYCQELERLLVEDGATVDARKIVTDLVAEAKLCEADVVVNCTGLNAATIATDDKAKMKPGRGVVLRFARPKNSHFKAVVTAEDGPLATPTEPAYFIPRNDVVVVGGTYNEGVFNDVASPSEIDRLKNVAATFAPDHFTVDPLAVWVGHRPVRTAGVRVELSPKDAPSRFIYDDQEPQVTVAHNYGHGGAGMTLAWGCADDIADAIAGFRLKKRRRP